MSTNVKKNNQETDDKILDANLDQLKSLYDWHIKAVAGLESLKHYHEYQIKMLTLSIDSKIEGL